MKLASQIGTTGGEYVQELAADGKIAEGVVLNQWTDSYMQLQKGILQDIARYRKDNEWDMAKLREPDYQYDRTDFDTSIELLKGCAEGVRLEIPPDDCEGL